MEGILLINKPKDYTSHDVVAQMRGILRTRKIGHSGTLDPMATGVLPLFIGPATRAVDMLEDHTKRYRATFRLGITTDTQDITGEVVETRPVTVGVEEVRLALRGFLGEGEQIPPMYSAVQIGGKRLYQLARQGKVVERIPRPVTIYSLALVDYAENEYTIEVHSSGGTYIRTLCHDIGERLETGATVTELSRIQAGAYPIEDCLTISAVEQRMKEGTIEEVLLPVDSVFEHLPKLQVTSQQATHIFNGVRMTLQQFPLPADDTEWAVYAPEDTFIGVATASKERGQLVMKKRFAREVRW